MFLGCDVPVVVCPLFGNGADVAVKENGSLVSVITKSTAHPWNAVPEPTTDILILKTSA
jgi:hypothetical protein